MIEAIVAILPSGRAKGPSGWDPRARKLLMAYATSEHHHLAAENGIVLAIARVRLTRGDLAGHERDHESSTGMGA